MLRHFNPDKTVSRKEKYAYTPNFWRNKPESHSNSSDVASRAKSDKEMYEKFDFYTHRKNEIFRIANTLLRYQKLQFVIDASISGGGDLFPLFYAINQIGGKVLLTNLTLEELYKLKSCKGDASSSAARFILKEAAKFPNLFQNVIIKDTFGSVDNRIIRYCAKFKENVVLLTSDVEMCTNARMYYNITVHYLEPKNNSAYNKFLTKRTPDIRTLYFTRMVQGVLEIDAHSYEHRKISVFSNGVERTNEFVPLNIGDDVYVATSKNMYATFCHFKIISLDMTNNCKFIFGGRIKDSIDISKLPEASYRSFMREARREIEL